jgi:hypothetical protein
MFCGILGGKHCVMSCVVYNICNWMLQCVNTVPEIHNCKSPEKHVDLRGLKRNRSCACAEQGYERSWAQKGK